MKLTKLSQYVSFSPGKNPSRPDKRFEGTSINFYDQSAFEVDLRKMSSVLPKLERANQEGEFLSEGDVLISNSLQKAVLVSEENVNKVASLNFIRVNFLSDKIDKGYFVYLYNSFSQTQRQKERELQGTAAVQRIPLKALKEIEIPLPAIDLQKRLASIYMMSMKLQNELSDYADLVAKFSNQLIEMQIKEA